MDRRDTNQNRVARQAVYQSFQNDPGLRRLLVATCNRRMLRWVRRVDRDDVKRHTARSGCAYPGEPTPLPSGRFIGLYQVVDEANYYRRIGLAGLLLASWELHSFD